MTAFRRTTWNFALQRAVEWAAELHKPLVVLEALRCDYPWASDRLHRFVVQGMEDNRAALAERRAVYYPYVEPERGAGTGLLAELARQAAVVVTDDYPCFFLPAQARAAARQIAVRFETVDSNGLLPLRSTERVFGRAYDFRRYLQQTLPAHWDMAPSPDPLDRASFPTLDGPPPEILRRWPAADVAQAARSTDWLAALPIDHGVSVVETAGGSTAAEARWKRFEADRLDRYGEGRNDPDDDVASGLSPYLHFGHVSVHELFHRTMRRERWTAAKVAAKPTGSSSGWWGASPSVESFLDELITWREVGFNFCSKRRDYDRYESLPDWARATLEKHATDPRPNGYELEEFDRAATHDPLWNAAQRQLLREGKIHNYLRMLWGKKILEWSSSPRAALAVMIELNNRYALDGRDPNSYSGIFWTLGRYDRPWAPERPIFGQIRYMSSDNTARKLKLKQYLEKYSARPAPRPRELF